jgi:hypothetical protein
MKSIFKFLTVALAAGMVVSCSDDLGLEQTAKYSLKKGDLVGTLYSAETRTAVLDELTYNSGTNSWEYPSVWSEDDEVNVFSPKHLNFNQYKVADNQLDGEGPGYPKAKFEPTLDPDDELLTADDLYAITEASLQYGVSAVDPTSGKILLTTEIPQAFDWETVAARDNAYKIPAPFWGPASFGQDGELNVGFRPLAAALRIDLAEMPEGVQAIVLISGNSSQPGATYMVNDKEYFGTGEGISGTFKAVLDVKSADRPALGIDEQHLRCFDTLRVDLPEATEAEDDVVLFIPLIAQHYDNLRIIAVTEDWSDPYDWEGEILRTFTDVIIENGKTYDIKQTANQIIEASSPAEISKEIALMYDGKHSLVVSVPYIMPVPGDNTIYIVSNDKSEVGQTSVTINFPAGLDVEELNIVEAPSISCMTGGCFNGFNLNKRATLESKSKAKQRTVTLNFDAFEGEAIDLDFARSTRSTSIDVWDSEDDDYEFESTDMTVNVLLPSSDVVMSSEAYLAEVNVISSNTYNVSGYDFDWTYNAVSNEQNAALKFTGLYNVVNYYGEGAVYFYGDESEIDEELNIFGVNPKSLRITDGLVNTITYPEVSNQTITTYIYTTGSAAIKQLVENDDKVKIKAYWTSKRLTPYAVAMGYEGIDTQDLNYNIEEGAIYTAAQLQGMGLSAGFYEQNDVVYNYTISPKVESIWLGGVTWPWIGPEIEQMSEHWSSWQEHMYGATLEGGEYYLPVPNGEKITQDFTLDGRNVTLKNMILDIYDPNFLLPGCCGTVQKIRVTENLGLIRSIKTTETVEIFNIQLDDVLLDTHKYAIDNVGSLVGIIDAEGDVTIGGSELGITTSNFTDIRIASKGNNIGGIVGELESAGHVLIQKVKVESIEENNQYISGGHIIGKSNVGGLVGNLNYDEYYEGSDADFGSTTPVDPIDVFYAYQIFKGVNDDSMNWYLEDGTKWYSGTDENVLKKMTQHLFKLNDNATAYVLETASKPVAGTVYYTAEWDEVQAVDEEGNLVWQTDPDTGEYQLDGDGNKIPVMVEVHGDTYTRLGTITQGHAADNKYYYVNHNGVKVEVTFNQYTKVWTKKPGTTGESESDYVVASTPFDLTLDAENYTKYWYIETVQEDQKPIIVDGDYPMSLTVKNAKVNLDKAAFDGVTEGIIKGEKGNNVGGLIGNVVVNGAVDMWEGLTVTVPTILATTVESKATLADKSLNFGSNVGGSVGYFFNWNDIALNKFAGTYKARNGMFAQSECTGGVIGYLYAKRNNPNGEGIPEDWEYDLTQVQVGNNAAVSVEANEISAIYGWVGGLVGYQDSGKMLVAGSNTASVNVKVIMQGSNCVGGLIGEQNDRAYINGSSKNITVTLANVENTKPISYFASNAERNYLGTIGTVVGQKNYFLRIWDGKLTISNGAFSDAKKEKLLYKYHGTAATTLVPGEKYFWGDKNKSYVGFGKESSMYFINDHEVQGNYEYNIYKVY